MATVSDEMLQDGKTLERIFREADELISAGELDFRDFSSPLARKVIFLQHELSTKGSPESLDERKALDFRNRTKRFLTGLKDGSLTKHECSELARKIKHAYPKMSLPKGAKK